MSKPVHPTLDIADAPEVIPVRLAHSLGRAIVTGKLPGGLRLTEDLVLEWTAFSRSPVREALRILEQDGLVTREPRRGVRVTPMSLADLDDIYQVRVPLEGLAAECAARAADAADVVRLSRLAALLGSRRVLGDAEKYLDWNLSFSEALYDAAHNPTLQRVIVGLSKQALRYRFLVYARSAAFRQASLEGAQALAEAIRGRDPERARRVQQDLVEASWVQVRPHVEALVAREAVA